MTTAAQALDAVYEAVARNAKGAAPHGDTSANLAALAQLVGVLEPIVFGAEVSP